MGKKQIDVAFTDGVIGQASNDKIVNLDLLTAALATTADLSIGNRRSLPYISLMGYD